MQPSHRRADPRSPPWPRSAPAATTATSLDDLAARPRHPQADDPLLVPLEGGAAGGGGRPLRRRGDPAARARPRPRPATGFGRVEAMVRAMFRLAARHPSMLGFLREVTRLGPPGVDPAARPPRAAGRPGRGVPRGRDGCRPHAPARPPAPAAGRLLDGDRAGHGGRGAPGLRRGADARRRWSAAATSCSRSCGPSLVLVLTLDACCGRRCARRPPQVLAAWSRAGCGARGARGRGATSSSIARRRGARMAAHSFGYIEIGVKPGMVLTSLTSSPRPASS